MSSAVVKKNRRVWVANVEQCYSAMDVRVLATNYMQCWDVDKVLLFIGKHASYVISINRDWWPTREKYTKLLESR